MRHTRRTPMASASSQKERHLPFCKLCTFQAVSRTRLRCTASSSELLICIELNPLQAQLRHVARVASAALLCFVGSALFHRKRSSGPVANTHKFKAVTCRSDPITCHLQFASALSTAGAWAKAVLLLSGLWIAVVCAVRHHASIGPEQACMTKICRASSLADCHAVLICGLQTSHFAGNAGLGKICLPGRRMSSCSTCP